MMRRALCHSRTGRRGLLPLLLGPLSVGTPLRAVATAFDATPRHYRFLSSPRWGRQHTGFVFATGAATATLVAAAGTATVVLCRQDDRDDQDPHRPVAPPPGSSDEHSLQPPLQEVGRRLGRTDVPTRGSTTHPWRHLLTDFRTYLTEDGTVPCVYRDAAAFVAARREGDPGAPDRAALCDYAVVDEVAAFLPRQLLPALRRKGFVLAAHADSGPAGAEELGLAGEALSRAVACLVGGALGDALGCPLER